MTSRSMKSSKNSPDLVREKLVRDKYALLARVGQRKREASAFQDEAVFYFTIVTELLALSAGLLEGLQEAEETNAQVKSRLLEHTSHYHRLIRSLLSFWPKNSESQVRILSLLDCDGLEKALACTPDGYVSLSTDQILENVARAIEVIKEENLRT